MIDAAFRDPKAPSRRFAGHPWLLLIVAGAVPACGADGGLLGGGGGAGSEVWVVRSGGFASEDTLTAIDSQSGEAVRSVPVEGAGEGLAVTEGWIWAVYPGADAVLAIDPESGDTERIQLPEGSRPSHLTFGEGAVWVGCNGDGNVVRIDPSSRQVVASIRITDDESIDQPLRVATGEGAVWVVDFFGNRDLHRIDPATNEVTGTVDEIGDGAVAAVVGGGSVWVTSVHDGLLTRVDPGTLEITARVGVGAMPLGVAYGAGAVWVASRSHGTVARVDPSTNRLTGLVRVGEEPLWVAVAGGSVWVTDQRASAVARIDPSTSEVVATLPLTSRPHMIAFDPTASRPAEPAALPGTPAHGLPPLARELGYADDACALLTEDEVGAAAGEPVRAQGLITGWDASSCSYSTASGGRPVLGLEVSWRDGREELGSAQVGTAIAGRLMEGIGGAEIDVDEILRPGPVPGLGDAALYHDIMPSMVLAGDTLLHFTMFHLPDAERHFVPLARSALARLGRAN